MSARVPRSRRDNCVVTRASFDHLAQFCSLTQAMQLIAPAPSAWAAHASSRSGDVPFQNLHIPAVDDTCGVPGSRHNQEFASYRNGAPRRTNASAAVAPKRSNIIPQVANFCPPSYVASNNSKRPTCPSSLTSGHLDQSGSAAARSAESRLRTRFWHRSR